MSRRQSVREEQEEIGWVLESLVGYLRGSIWQAPVLKFLEDKSVVFGPEDSEEWQIEFEKVFDEYKNLIDDLLDRHMQELDISPEQFENACQEAEGILSARLHQTLFEQIWAASDFDTFKRMMIQLNIDLQLYALEMLAQKHGLVPKSFLFEGSTEEQFLKDDHLFHEVVRRSLDDNGSQPSTQKLVEVHHVPEDLASVENTQVKCSPSTPNVLDKNELPSQEQKEKFAHNKSIGEDKMASKFRRPSSSKDESGISVDEIRSRQEYLRKQRDKLLDIKKEERQKQLERMQKRRPKTGKLSKTAQSSSTEEKEDSSTGLKYRQSLAARIKSEVIDCSDDES